MTLNKVISIILITNSFSTICFADDVVYVNKDDKAPFQGYLFSDAKAKEVKFKLIDLDTNIKLNESLNKSIELYKANEIDLNKKVEILNTQNNNLAENLYKAREVSFWDRFGFFLLGVAGTTLAVYGVKKAAQ
jgi:hypothetical protein